MAKRRPSGDGLVRKREDGRWEGRIVVGHKRDGSPIFKSVFGKTQKETLGKLHQAIELYRDVDLTEDSRLTLGEWMDKWLDEYMLFTVRESTLDGYRTMVKNYVKPYLGNKQLAFLTTADVQKFYNTVKREGRIHPHPIHGKQLADSMVRKIHMMLHEAMEAALRERLIAKNPTNGTAIPKNNYAEKQILDDRQLEIFMETIRTEPDWYDFFYTELMTGMRRGEICGLKWSDFDSDSGILKIRRSVSQMKGGGLRIGQTKTDTGERTIILPPSVTSLLTERKKNALTEWIFPNLYKPEEPMNPASAYNKLKVILRHAELPMLRFHDLRHTFSTHALANGVDAKTLSAMIGHISAETTLNIYSHITDNMRRQAAVRIDRGIGGTDAPMPEIEPCKPSCADTGEDVQKEFVPYTGKIRKSGTGCIYQVSERLWEGSFSPRMPDGKRKKFNIYAETRAEVEAKLPELIAQVKADIAAEKARLAGVESEA